MKSSCYFLLFLYACCSPPPPAVSVASPSLMPPPPPLPRAVFDIGSCPLLRFLMSTSFPLPIFAAPGVVIGGCHSCYRCSLMLTVLAATVALLVGTSCHPFPLRQKEASAGKSGTAAAVAGTSASSPLPPATKLAVAAAALAVVAAGTSLPPTAINLAAAGTSCLPSPLQQKY